MRLRKSDLTRRVNADLAIRFEKTGLTSFAGLELLRRYFCLIELRQQIRRFLCPVLPRTDFGVPGLVVMFLILIITGGRRLRHLGHLEGDTAVLRCCGLTQLPSAPSAGRWLAKFDERAIDGLHSWNEHIVAEGIQACGLRRLTLDIDGSVVSTGLTVQGARRGFNPHRRKVPSYYPITAYEANSGQVLRVQNRPGNIHDGKAAVEFLEALVEQLRRTSLDHLTWEFRMDGAFFRADIIERLESWQAEYAIKVPFYQWLDLQSLIAQRKRWHRVNDQVSYFETALEVDTWQWSLPVVIYRKRTHHQTRKNYQLDLFDPDDGYYEYSAILSNKSVSGATLWHFMCGRGMHEKVYGELKTGFAFSTVPTHGYLANCAWQVFSILAFNLIHSFQRAIGAPVRTANRKRRSRHLYRSIRTLRFNFINRAGIITRPNGRATMDVGTSRTVKTHFQHINQMLSKAA